MLFSYGLVVIVELISLFMWEQQAEQSFCQLFLQLATNWIFFRGGIGINLFCSLFQLDMFYINMLAPIMYWKWLLWPCKLSHKSFLQNWDLIKRNIAQKLWFELIKKYQESLFQKIIIIHWHPQFLKTMYSKGSFKNVTFYKLVYPLV